LKVLDIINFKNPIKFVKNVGNNQLLVSDLKNNFRLIDTSKNFEVLQSISIPNIPEAELHNNKIDVSYGAKYLAVEDAENKVVKVFDFLNKKGKFNIDWHKGRVETVAFDFQNKYLATGGQDGKSFIWSIQTGRMVHALPHHADFVTAMSFTKNGTRIATGGYDKKIMISNLYSMKKPLTLAGSHTNCIKFLYFISNGRLVSFDKDGVIVVWDYVSGRVIKTLKKTAAEPVAVTFIFNFNFMLVACKDDNIYLYDMEDYKLLQHDYLRIEEGISEFAYIFDEGIFAIGTLRGAVILYNMKNDEEGLESQIASKNFEEAYKLVRENPILRYSPLYDRLEEIWEKTSKKASSYLDQGMTDKAKLLFKPFMKVPGKNTYIKNILDDYIEFKKFKALVETKKYQLAYSMVLSHPTYKDSEIYLNMEKDWKTRVEKAKTILLKDVPNSQDLIQNLFADFRGISAKAVIIRSIMTDKSALSMFNRKFRERKFDDCFRLANKYIFIKELADYARLIQYEDVLYNKMHTALNASEYKKTIEYAKQLLVFPNYKTEASHILKNIETTIAFRSYYTSKQYNEMLKLISHHPFLETLDEYEEFNKDWYKMMSEAEKSAAKGNIKGILTALSTYIDIDERAESIGHVLSAAYIQQLNFISKKESKNPFKTLEAINEYLKIFGMTEDLIGFLDYIDAKYSMTFIDSELELNDDTKQEDFIRWREYEKLPSSIVKI
jgi:hypothetical protein